MLYCHFQAAAKHNPPGIKCTMASSAAGPLSWMSCRALHSHSRANCSSSVAALSNPFSLVGGKGAGGAATPAAAGSTRWGLEPKENALLLRLAGLAAAAAAAAAFGAEAAAAAASVSSSSSSGPCKAVETRLELNHLCLDDRRDKRHSVHLHYMDGLAMLAWVYSIEKPVHMPAALSMTKKNNPFINLSFRLPIDSRCKSRTGMRHRFVCVLHP